MQTCVPNLQYIVRSRMLVAHSKYRVLEKRSQFYGQDGVGYCSENFQTNVVDGFLWTTSHLLPYVGPFSPN